tara:strand:- start:113 stop:259 length:147 start_codon:yes stop_codon:yes gene_type:complete
MDPEFRRLFKRLARDFIVETATQLLDDKPKSKPKPKTRKKSTRRKKNA